MRNTTLCYIERGQQYLMLHRVKKENDLNHDKWVGIGGKFEGNETPDECLLREAHEETGLTLTDWRCRGVVTFLSDTWEGEYMYLFTAGGFTGTLRACNEGVLSWVDKAAVPALPMWEGDKIFFRLLAETLFCIGQEVGTRNLHFDKNRSPIVPPENVRDFLAGRYQFYGNVWAVAGAEFWLS